MHITFGALFLIASNYFLKLEQSYLVLVDELRFLQDASGPDQNYDYVIVGAGSSGCILANRLSLNNKVLLLDSGTTPPSLVSVIGLYREIFNQPEINFLYRTVPQTSAFNRIIQTSVGKMLGGTYSHNAVHFNRGSRFDYDNWAKFLQDESFSYKNLLKYFKILEDYKGDFPGPTRGKGGFIPIVTDNLPLNDIWFEAGRELGYPIGDPNVILQNVFTTTELSRLKGRRATTYTQYIEPILTTRRNLNVIRFAHVEQVEFSGRVARSVIYKRHGKEFRVTSRKEIIVSAGSYGSSVILFKSGVGPKEMLEEAEIPVVQNLPVGKRLEDHPVVQVRFRVKDASKFINLKKDLTKMELIKYIRRKNEDNVLSTSGNGPIALIASKLANTFNGNIWPDIYLRPSTPTPHRKNEFSISVTNGRPHYNARTIGNFRLNTTAYKLGIRDPTMITLIDYKLMQSKETTEVLLEGIRVTEKILDTDAFQSIGAKLMKDKFCSRHHKFRSRSYWKCYIKKAVTMDYHPAGTNRMGPDRGRFTDAVVDTKFRVFGLSRLRVVDASIFPKISTANINAAVCALAEKAAEDILH